jgi:CDP-glucose 4,6-dehydratase
MRYLVTGHTGFKGAWLSLWLAEQGHSVHGLALDPEPDGLFEVAQVASRLASDARLDIRDASSVQSAVAEAKPDVVIHLAAQPLVRESYVNPRWTFETNAMGTMNVLEAVSTCDSVQAHVVVTTDKVYRNVHQTVGYIEDDALGGDDPYSASKAMADILTHSWLSSFGGPPTAIARAGNVIGGGDMSRDRLIPDIMNACRLGQNPILRYPDSVRPWQHVLDCLNGYTMLVDHLLSSPGTPSDRGAWNFGPNESSFVTVGEVTTRVLKAWGLDSTWELAPDATFHEAALLALDASKATNGLGWHDKLNIDEAIDWTVQWYRDVNSGLSPNAVTMRQLDRFNQN